MDLRLTQLFFQSQLVREFFERPLLFQLQLGLAHCQGLQPILQVVEALRLVTLNVLLLSSSGPS